MLWREVIVTAARHGLALLNRRRTPPSLPRFWLLDLASDTVIVHDTARHDRWLLQSRHQMDLATVAEA